MNLVQVPVIVLDRDGVPVRGLKKESFQLFDKGKRQEIVSFSEESADRARREPGATNPEHFIAYFFDDVAINEAGDLTRIRDAMEQRLDTLPAVDRAAIFTSSCRVQVDFTDDRSKLRTAASTLRARAIPVCRVSKSETLQISVLGAIVARMASLPAQRVIILISPGFHIGHDRSLDEARLIEHATRAKVLINALDVGEITSGNPIATPDQPRMPQWQSATDETPQALTTNPLVLNELAHGTGGRYVEGGNDFAAGFRKLATPECFYVLGFVPQGKQDGSYHQLKVKLMGAGRLDVHARNAYYALPSPGGDESSAPKPLAQSQPKAATAASSGVSPIAASAEVSSQSEPEIVQHSESATFKASVNLVQVPVVVRDRKANSVGGLREDDFQLFDNGKRQQITRFLVQEGRGVATGATSEHRPSSLTARSETAEAPVPPPDHFVAFFFDDIHIRFQDLPQVRDAVRRFVRSSLQAGDRAALYTASGRVGVDFTDRPQDLEAALLRVRPNPIAAPTPSTCLGVSYFQAVRIDEEVSLHPILPDDIKRSLALKAAAFDDSHCGPNPRDPTGSVAGGAGAESEFASADLQKILDAYTSGKQESRAVLEALRRVVQRMALMSGQRSVVLVSPGFFVSPDLQDESSALIELAVRSRVIISAIDARGVWTNPVFDAGMQGTPAPPDVIAFIDQDRVANGEELRTLAEATGGTLNVDNDFDGGVRKAAAAPDYLYVLGFSPQNLKTDGSFHRLRVTLNAHSSASVQARRGYYAPRRADNPNDVARQEIENAVFSRDELRDLPVELHTDISRAGDAMKLNLTANLNIALLHYREINSRHNDDVTVVWTLFDNNGNFLSGTQTLVQLRLKGETMARLAETSTMTAKASFDVKPGDYLLRMVARDAEGQQMAAENASVHVP